MNKNKEEKFRKKAYETILYLWENRKYGIKEMEYFKKVCELIPHELIGLRPVNENGISYVPKIENGRISYTDCII